MPHELPTGTVTFLFTDIEGSSRLWELHPATMAAAVARQEELLREKIAAHRGHVFKTQGDAVSAAFRTAGDALLAAVHAQTALHAEEWCGGEPIRVRVALHTGTAEARGADYHGAPLNRVARLVSAAHGGQVLLSLACEELVREQLPEGVTLIDLGEHRLRDLSRSERIFQAVHPDLPSQFPPLRTLDARPNNLPVQRTPLVGREQDVQEVRKLLTRMEGGLVTLSGPGGSGKSRLGLQVGAELVDEFEDGVYFVPLGATREAPLVAAAVARALGLRVEGDASALETLKEHLRSKHVLLILDNFEQVVDAASVATELLKACPAVKILVTSRAVLRVSGEREYPVPPLPQPDSRRITPDEACRYPAIELFVQRAQAVQPEFRLTRENAPMIAEICARLDGLPLAIELAAARVKMLPPEQMLARLDNRLKLLTRGARDLPDRQQTLRGAIGWGYDLLSEEEKTVFRRLCIFSGGFTLPMAQAVCGPEGEMELELLDGLASLVDKSFLRHEQAEGRFTLLGTIREFGIEELVASGEMERMHRSHAACMVDLAREAEQALRGPEQAAWLDRLELEHENLRVALDWGVEAEGASEEAWRLAGSLWRFWFLRGYVEEGRSYLERLAARRAPGSVAARARALTGAAFLAFFHGDARAAERHFRESMRLSDEACDLWHLAFSLCGLGSCAQYRGDHARARVALQRGANLARKLGDPWLIGLALSSHWASVVAAGDFASSEPMFEECLEHCRAAGDPSLTAWPLMILGVIHHVTGRLDTAEAYLAEGTVLAQEVRNNGGVSSGLEGIAEIWIKQGRLEEGARLLGASQALHDANGNARQPYGLPMYNEALATLRERLGEAEAEALLAEGRRLSTDEALALALGHEEERCPPREPSS